MARILIYVAFTLGCLTAGADELSKAIVKNQAQEMADATIAGDYAKLIDHTYPPAVEAQGGRKEAVQSAEATMKLMNDKGFTITKYEVGEPGNFYSEGGNTFVVIPSTMEMKFPAGKAIQKPYLLGISSDAGKTWSFIDCSGPLD